MSGRDGKTGAALCADGSAFLVYESDSAGASFQCGDGVGAVPDVKSNYTDLVFGNAGIWNQSAGRVFRHSNRHSDSACGEPDAGT